MASEKRYPALILGSILICLSATVLSLMLGGVFISPADIFRMAFGRAGDIETSIFLYSRLPRTAACLLSGAALSCAGAVLQNVLANRLASPSIIGVNAGAGLGVTAACALGFVSGAAISAAAFVGSLITVFVIALFSRATFSSRTTVILGGVALNSIISAISESIAVLDPDVAMLTTEFRVGGFSSVSYTRLLPAGIMIISALLLIFTLLNELDVLSLGDETAQNVGLRVKCYRTLFLALSALLAGAAVSFSGLLGFMGLIVPHFARRLVGSESRRLLPLTVVSGGALLCLSDLAARMLFLPYELPVGMVTAIIGGPVFVLVLLRSRGGHRNA